MPTNRSKDTGTTAWGFAKFLFENPSILKWIAAIGWAIVVVAAIAIWDGKVSVRIPAMGVGAEAGSPWADWTFDSVTLEPAACEAVAIKALQNAGAKESVTNDDNADEVYSTGSVGSLLVTIVCRRQTGGSLIHIGVYGDSLDRARNLRNTIKTAFAPHLVRR